MKAVLRQIEDISSENVIFYTLQYENKEIPEFADFQRRMKIKYAAELSEINKFIRGLSANESGAEYRFFKKQNDADRLRLPTPDTFDKNKADPKSYGLRLYGVWLSERTVILLNGDLKTYLLAQRCPNCQTYFDQANKIALAVHAAKYMTEIEIDEEGYILTEEDYKLEIL